MSFFIKNRQKPLKFAFLLPKLFVVCRFQLHLALAVAHQQHLPFKNGGGIYLNGDAATHFAADDAASTSSGAAKFGRSRRAHWEERNGHDASSRSAPLSRSSSRYSMPDQWGGIPPAMSQQLRMGAPPSSADDCPVCQMLLPANGPVCFAIADAVMNDHKMPFPMSK